jgi:hypothetical protein
LRAVPFGRGGRERSGGGTGGGGLVGSPASTMAFRLECVPCFRLDGCVSPSVWEGGYGYSFPSLSLTPLVKLIDDILSVLKYLLFFI